METIWNELVIWWNGLPYYWRWIIIAISIYTLWRTFQRARRRAYHRKMRDYFLYTAGVDIDEKPLYAWGTKDMVVYGLKAIFAYYILRAIVGFLRILPQLLFLTLAALGSCHQEIPK